MPPAVPRQCRQGSPACAAVIIEATIAATVRHGQTVGRCVFMSQGIGHGRHGPAAEIFFFGSFGKFVGERIQEGVSVPREPAWLTSGGSDAGA